MKKVKVIQTRMSREIDALEAKALATNPDLMSKLELGWKIESTIPMISTVNFGATYGVIHILTINREGEDGIREQD